MKSAELQDFDRKGSRLAPGVESLDLRGYGSLAGRLTQYEKLSHKKQELDK